jgi:Regulator of chromosome condensation (RCC1) repeat
LVWAWGWNINGQLADNTTTDGNIPVQVIFLQPALFLPFVVGQTRWAIDSPSNGILHSRRELPLTAPEHHYGKVQLR